MRFKPALTVLVNWLKRQADHVSILLMAGLFVAFMVQILARYVFNNPLTWTLEVCLTLWLWLVFWTSSFSLRHDEHIRFDMVYLAVSRPIQRWFSAIAALIALIFLIASLMPTWGFVSFLEIKKSAALRLPLNWVFMIYPIFLVATCLMFVVRLKKIFMGEPLADLPASLR